jgi:Ca2+-binding EF-hand superfamily protein
LWDKYDEDGSGALDVKETKALTKDIMDMVGSAFNKDDFERAFKAMDVDGNGVVDRTEMVGFL